MQLLQFQRLFWDCRYVLAMGYSLQRSNGQILRDEGVDTVLMTYSDIKFGGASLSALQAVGWTLRAVRRPWRRIAAAMQIFIFVSLLQISK